MINSVVLMGRLTRTPECRSTENGTAVTAFRIAVDRRFTSSGGEKQTDFFDIVAWRSTAVFVADHFNKGDMIAVRGARQRREDTDKNGNNRRGIEVVADEISFC